ncbi:MAG TPA: 3-phosphoshikimate 1-carboxyvinyltransferase [Burkholderiales bacterium]|nr:3-phosphoshikimate 1-carboxyvinyltransferase [Burkholderiales bacterium]
MKTLDLKPATAARGTVRLPGSKSITNRVLLLAALSGAGKTVVRGALDAEDTRVMIGALQKLGVPLDDRNFAEILVPGRGGRFSRKKDLFLGNAGTAYRSLTAVLALAARGEYRLMGVPRMHERPIGDLVKALHAFGAHVDYVGEVGYPPLVIKRGQVDTRKPVKVRGDVSSQFVSALLMALPLAGGGTIEIEGELVSKPYVEITLNLMRRFGVDIARHDWRKFRVSNAHYTSPGELHVEGDASSASYFLAAGALAGGPVRVEGVGKDSIQGDVRFTEVLERMGASVTFDSNAIEVKNEKKKLSAIDLDLNHIPDAAMTAAVLALFAEGTTTIRNIANWRVKETDRIAAMAKELRKLGAEVEEGPDFIRIKPGKKVKPDVSIDTYGDHRMAMCFSLVSLAGVPVTINDPDCVAKTFPDYFKTFQSIAKP